MLAINWDDVIALLKSIQWQLIGVGLVLLAAIIVTIAVRRASLPTRKFTRATTWVAAIVAIAVLVTTMLYGGLRNLLNLASASGTLTEQTITEVADLAEDISDEGMVLLKNTDATLPLEKGTKLNVFGWASTNPIYGGTGSGSLNDAYEKTGILDGLHNAGFETNQALTDFYTAYRADRPVVGMFQADWTLPEPAASTYPADLLAGVKSYSDTAVVTIGRSGGEGFDLPQDVNAEMASNKAFSFTDNSTDYKEFADGEGYLTLTRSERDMIDLAKANADRVVVIYNGANAFELESLEKDPEIDAIVWALPAGQRGFNSLGRILDGEVNPSAKTPDTFLADIESSPAAKNFGDFTYTNMEEFGQTSPFTKATTYPAFVSYNEGIYVGYRFWETAAVEGVVDYDAAVTYPFGFGLSYTTFEQELDDVTLADGTVTATVTVTNTGDVAGKEVAELYFTPPYTNGGIEKAAVNLAAYGKTKLLEPGQSETLTLTFDEDDMASYDMSGDGHYVLEAGTYTISLRTDSHTVVDQRDVQVGETITYDEDSNTHDGDLVAAHNEFASAAGDVTYLSRADHFANLEAATAAPASLEISDEAKAAFVATQNYDAKAADQAAGAAEMPTTGADNGLLLGDMHGLAYDDPKWEQLLDQLSVDDMNTLIANGGYKTPAISSVGKVQTVDVDGPASLNNNFTKVGSIGLPVSVSVAATWNTELADAFGEAIAKMAHEMDVAGWYAPAMNTHRYAYAGRNFEYFSEDPVLAGTQAAHEVAGAQKNGVYAFIKHFAFNDQETNRNNMLVTWSNEQALREIYLRPFELSVKDGGATAVMSAFNYIGTVYAGAAPELLNDVLRGEWGFRGMVLTDYFAGYGYQNADQIVRGGGDVMLATLDMGVNSVNERSANGVAAMRTAAHNILYTTANSWIYENGQPEVEVLPWEWATRIVLVVGAIVLAALEVVAVRRFLARRREAASVTVVSVQE